MSDDSMIKIMQSLGMDYNPAIDSTIKFQKNIADLNKELADMKATAIQSAKDVNNAFSSQLGQRGGNKDISDQFKAVKQEAQSTATTVGKMAKEIKKSNLANMQAQASYVQQRVSAKGLSEEYSSQASTLREQLSIIQARLQTEGKLSAEEIEQTNQLKEQLDILRAQTRTAIHDENRLNPPTPNNEFEKKSSWFTDGAKFYAVSRAAKEATSTIKKVEMGMVEIGRVVEDTSFVFDGYRDNLFKLGVDYGQTFDNVQSIALRWAQSGYNVADSLELTKTSLLALNTAELDAKNATESMIGIMAQWQLQAEDMALVMDKINITADNYSITSQDLVDGMLRSSSAARNMNMTLDETIGLLTVMREASGRTGAEVGNALNSILSYIQRPKSIDTLEDMGIQMFTDSTKSHFRNALDIFKDISTSWGALSAEIQDGFVKSADDAGLFSEEMANALGIQEQWNDVQQRDVSQASAGVYRRNYFIGMIERMSNVQGVLNGMIDAEGYSMAENAKTMETLEKKQESLKASVEALAVAMGDAGLNGALKLLADGGTNALGVLNGMPKEMKDLVLATTATYTAIKTLEFGMKTFGIEVPNISSLLTTLKLKVFELGNALNGGTAGMMAFAKANPILALSAAVGVLVAVTNATKKQREEQEKLVDAFNNQKDISQELNRLLQSYKNLGEQSSLTTEQQTELLDVKQKIKDLLPESKTALDNENLSLSEQISIIESLNNAELERLKLQAQKQLNRGESSYEQDKKDLEDATKMLEILNKQWAEYSTKQLDGTATKAELNALKAITTAIERETEKRDIATTGIEAYESSLKLMTNTTNSNTGAIKSNADVIETLNNDYKVTEEMMDELIKSFDHITDRIQTYQTILAELNSKEGLSVKTRRDIITNHQELLPYLSDEKELRKQLIKIIEEEEKVQKKAYANMIVDNEQFFESKIKGNSILVDKLGEFYTKDLENAKSLAKAKEMVENELIKNLSVKWAKYYGALTTGHNQKLEDGLVRSAMAGNSEANEVLKAVQSYKDVQNRFENIAIDLGGVDFKGINMSGIKDTKSTSKKDPKYENKALDSALKMLEHRKKITEETKKSIQDELNELKRIDKAYVKTADERMAMTERIYSVEKRLRDRTLQDSVNWINQKKSLNELSVEDEIEAWERIKNNQGDNIEAMKQATLNLYKLKEQLRVEDFNKEENNIKHLTKLGIYGVEEQINAYKDLYKTKADSLEDERNRIENLFGLYKNLINEQQKTIKESHDDRIKQIDDERKASIEKIETESKLRKNAQEEVIKGIERELELLNKQENEYDHDKKMADLREQLAYWEVRTSEDARKKVIDLKKQIDEANHKREVDLQKEALNEKKQNAQDDIRNEEDKSKEKIKEIEETARKEIELAEKSYKQIEIAFDEHSIDMIALASTMSEGMFEEFQKNYLIPLENALRDRNYGSIGGIMDGINDFANDNSHFADDYNTKHDWGMSDADYKRFKANGDMWKQLQSQGSNQSNLAEMEKLNAENDRLREKYGRNPSLGEYPKFHEGGWAYSEGFAVLQKDELVFPPDLSLGISKLFPLLSNLAKSNISTETSSFTDSRKEVKIENLVRIDNNHMADDVDERSFSREIQRQLSGMF